jgi:hypothetical protein
MALPLNDPQDAVEGFDGEVAGLGLADVLQLYVLNRFSGCISIRFQGEGGKVFLRDGEFIHAEQGSRSGEDAFYEIISWPGGTFSLQPKVTTTRQTISKRWQFLILEGHRLMDERRARASAAPPAGPAAPVRESGGAIADRLRGRGGVVETVELGEDDRPAAGSSAETEALAGQAAYLAHFARQLGLLFEAGVPLAASARGERHHLVVGTVLGRSVAVLAHADGRSATVEADLARAAGAVA